MHGNREAPERRLALLIEYQGTAYGGSQYQKNAPTVQGTLERALSKLTGEQIRVTMAGRTDAGVHAIGQVASFRTSSHRSLDIFERGTNALLPDDISVRAAEHVALGFNPRRHATSRWYRYTIHVGPQKPALRRQFAWHVAAELDIGRMAKTTGLLEGLHDFAAFTNPSEAERSVTMRDISRATVQTHGRLATVDIEGNAFLRQMVRRIVGTLVEVGRGRMTEGEFEELIKDASPGQASKTAPPRGLCLMKVRYESGLFDHETDEDI